MITFDRVGVQYADTQCPSLVDVTLEIPEGELVLVVGPTGSGKSTMLRTINGLVPHFSGGRLTGSVRVDGLDTATHRPRDLATVVGLVEQNPAATFVTDVVEDELAYGMETMGLDPTTIRRSGWPSPRCSPPDPGSSSSTSRPPRSTRSPRRRSSPHCTASSTTSV
jgi:energy-coupling factor transport system ATP-binding protein